MLCDLLRKCTSRATLAFASWSCESVILVLLLRFKVAVFELEMPERAFRTLPSRLKVAVFQRTSHATFASRNFYYYRNALCRAGAAGALRVLLCYPESCKGRDADGSKGKQETAANPRENDAKQAKTRESKGKQEQGKEGKTRKSKRRQGKAKAKQWTARAGKANQGKAKKMPRKGDSDRSKATQGEARNSNGQRNAKGSNGQDSRGQRGKANEPRDNKQKQGA